MSYTNKDPLSCEAVTADLAELALGILSGRRRSEVLNHVGSCRRCSVELEQLSSTADMVLQLAPESEPPFGFEQRLFERLESSVMQRRPSGLSRTALFSVAVVSLLVVGFGLGKLAAAPRDSASNSPSPSAGLTPARLMSRGQVLGEVFVSRGKPEWIFMSIDNRAWSGTAQCEVVLAGGKVVTAGRFDLSAGYSAWAAALKSSVAHVRVVRVVSPAGVVLASAALSA